MSKFETLQEKINLLVNAHDSIQSLQREVIAKTVYIGEQLVDERGYENALDKKIRDEEKNKRTQEKIDIAVDNHNKILEEILGLIELDDQWLELQWNIIRKSGGAIEVYDNKVHYFSSQSNLSNSRSNLAKVKPKVFKKI